LENADAKGWVHPTVDWGSSVIRVDSTCLHDLYCANRSLGTAWLFVAFCGIEALVCWRALGKPRPVDSGAFFLFFQAYALLLVAFLFVAFKCVRERLVLGLALVTSVRALSFGFAPRLVSLTAGLVSWTPLALWLTAFVVSLSMLASASRNTRS
jgi:hypothetical protein